MIPGDLLSAREANHIEFDVTIPLFRERGKN
jgi:hypothetical protein